MEGNKVYYIHDDGTVDMFPIKDVSCCESKREIKRAVLKLNPGDDTKQLILTLVKNGYTVTINKTEDKDGYARMLVKVETEIESIYTD